MTPSRQRLRSACTGGCNFAVDPSHSAIDEPIHWTTIADPGKIALVAAAALGSVGQPQPALDTRGGRRCANELHAIQGNAVDAIPFVLIDGATSEQALAVLIPLDADTPDRLDAVWRFWSALAARPLATDPRITPQRRHRLRHMLRAFDGRACSATYREIAEVLFGVPRVASDPWKTSALRDATIRLVRDGLAMVNGGYRDLLRRRRRR